MSSTIGSSVEAALGPDLPIAVVAYDGTSLGPDDPSATIEVRSPEALHRVLGHAASRHRLRMGGMVIHAARHCGVDAVGITVSRVQADLAVERVADAGLADRVEIRHSRTTATSPTARSTPSAPSACSNTWASTALASTLIM